MKKATVYAAVVETDGVVTSVGSVDLDRRPLQFYCDSVNEFMREFKQNVVAKILPWSDELAVIAAAVRRKRPTARKPATRRKRAAAK